MAATGAHPALRRNGAGRSLASRGLVLGHFHEVMEGGPASEHAVLALPTPFGMKIGVLGWRRVPRSVELPEATWSSEGAAPCRNQTRFH